MAAPNSIREQAVLSDAAHSFLDRLHFTDVADITILACLIAHDDGRTNVTFGDCLHAFASWNNGITRLFVWNDIVAFAKKEREDFGGISVG